MCSLVLNNQSLNPLYCITVSLSQGQREDDKVEYQFPDQMLQVWAKFSQQGRFGKTRGENPQEKKSVQRIVKK